MPTMTRNEAIAVCGGAVGNKIIAATWKRRVDKKKAGVIIAAAGETVTMQFIPRIPQRGTVNWNPKGGFCFNAATKAAADAIKRRKGLVGVLKMSETGTNDTRGLPRTVPVMDFDSLTVEGQTFDIVDVAE